MYIKEEKNEKRVSKCSKVRPGNCPKLAESHCLAWAGHKGLAESPWARAKSRQYEALVTGSRGAAARVMTRSAAVTALVTGRMLAASALLAIGFVCRKALDDPVPGQHASIHREVPAHHKSAHSRVLLSQEIRRIGQIGLVLAAVHQHVASVPAGLAVALIGWIMPSSTPAQTCMG